MILLSGADAEERKAAAISCYLATVGIHVFGIGQSVDNMNDFAFEQDAPGNRSAIDRRRLFSEELAVFQRVSIARFGLNTFAPRSPDDNRVRIAEARH